MGFTSCYNNNLSKQFCHLNLSPKIEGFRMLKNRLECKLNSVEVTWVGCFLLFCIDEVAGFLLVGIVMISKQLLRIFIYKT